VSDTLELARHLLATHALGPELTPELTAVLDACFAHRAEPGDVICREGEPSRDLYFLTRGRVQVRMRDYLGVEQDLAQLHAPTMFGHMGMVDGSPRSATCIALDDARILLLHREAYEALVDAQGPHGDMFRRLLLTAMNRQLTAGNRALQQLLAEPDDGADDTQRLGRISSTLEGWESGG
jgi:CRP/FNR family cyclic AMP-dependent transcriptional regulator